MVLFRSIHDIDIPPAGSCAALGLFDGLHPGHRSVIGAAVEKARQEGLTPCVFTFSMDGDHPAAKPMSGRLLTAEARVRLLGEMGVTHILYPPFEEFKSMTPEEYIRVLLHEKLRARFVFTGENYHFGKAAAGNVELLRRQGGQMGIRVYPQPMVLVDGAPVSSTRIRRCIAEGDMAGAGRLLGRPFALEFQVVQDTQPHLENPRLRQVIPPRFAKPCPGRYESVVVAGGDSWPAETVISSEQENGEALGVTTIAGWGTVPVTGARVELVDFLGEAP